MSHIITAIVSAMVGGAVGVVTMCLCVAAGRADEKMNKNGGLEK